MKKIILKITIILLVFVTIFGGGFIDTAYATPGIISGVEMFCVLDEEPQDYDKVIIKILYGTDSSYPSWTTIRVTHISLLIELEQKKEIYERLVLKKIDYAEFHSGAFSLERDIIEEKSKFSCDDQPGKKIHDPANNIINGIRYGTSEVVSIPKELFADDSGCFWIGFRRYSGDIVSEYRAHPFLEAACHLKYSKINNKVTLSVCTEHTDIPDAACGQWSEF